MAKNKSGYDVDYKFEYRGMEERYYYDIPFETFVEAIRAYFDSQMVTIDGKDNDVWNVCASLEILDDIYDAMEDWLKERCEKDAYEEYKDYIEWYYEDELAGNEYKDEDEQ